MNALVKYSAQLPAGPIDRSAVNYEAFDSWAARNSSSRTFAGREIGLNGKNGGYKIGYKEDVKELGDALELAWNHLYTVEAWQYWPAVGGPSYPAMVMPMLDGRELPARDVFTVEDGFEQDKPDAFNKKLRKDTFTKVFVMIFRSTETGNIFHLIVKPGGSVAVRNIMIEVARQARLRKNEIPVLHITWTKVKKDSLEWVSPEFKIVGWTKVTPADDPGSVMVEAEPDDVSGEDEEATVTARGTSKVATTADANAVVERVKKSKPVQKAEDEEEAEDEPEVKKPSKRAPAPEAENVSEARAGRKKLASVL